MKLEKYISPTRNRVADRLAYLTSMIFLGGLAVGALQLAITFLPLETIDADGPEKSRGVEEIGLDRDDVNIPDDAWMWDPPFYQDFGDQKF